MKHFNALTAAALAFGLCANASGAFVINELDSDTPGSDAAEYIELKGNPGESATGLILVFYDGSDGPLSFSPAVDLTGLTADENGYLLLGSDDVPGVDMVLPDAFIHNAQEAVALYQDLASNHPSGSSPTTTNLVDVVVHRATGSQSNDWTGFGTPPPPVYDEGIFGVPQNFSLSRLPDGTGTEFKASELTPGTTNQLKPPFSVEINFFPRVNQQTALESITRIATLRNSGSVSLTVNSLELATTSSAEFSVVPPFPTLPATLAYNQTTTIAVQLLGSDVSTNKTYTGAINCTTDSPTSPSVSLAFSTELVRSTQAAAVGEVKVNEICYTGNFDHNNDGTLANQGDEFVELVNMTNAPIVIEGWEQRCTDNDSPSFHSFVFPAGATLPANGFVTVFTGGTPTGFVPGTTFVYGIPRIRNNGAYVGVSDGTKLVDGVAYDLAQDTPDADAYLNAGVLATAGDTIGRRPDGSNTFRTFDTADPILTDRPTPNASNNIVAGIAEWSLF